MGTGNILNEKCDEGWHRRSRSPLGANEGNGRESEEAE